MHFAGVDGGSTRNTKCFPLIVGLLFHAPIGVVRQAEGKFVNGIISTANNWAYLDRFCFAAEGGELHYTVEYPQEFEIQSLFLYYDVESQWHSAYNTLLTCYERVRLIHPHNNQIVRLSPHAYRHVSSVDGLDDDVVGNDIMDSNDSVAMQDGDISTSCKTFQRNNRTWYRCSGTRFFLAMRPRWWFIVIGNCDSVRGVYAEYRLTMWNSPIANGWFRHFSFDEYYSLPISGFFLVTETLIVAVAAGFAYVLNLRKMLHTTYKTFIHSTTLEAISNLMMFVHLDRYADDGLGIPFLRLSSVLTRQLSILIFIALLLLIAKGYTITRARLSPCTNFKLFLFITIYFCLQNSMILWEIVSFNPARVTYISESLASYLLVALRLVAWIWCLRSSYSTAVKYPRKRLFFTILFTLISFWFWADPIALMVANFLLNNWVRAEVMLAVNGVVAAYGFIIFLSLTCPSSENTNFPYHIRTNQISYVDFPQNIYEMRSGSNDAVRSAQEIPSIPATEVTQNANKSGRTEAKLVNIVKNKHMFDFQI